METDSGTLTKQMEQLSQDLKVVTSALTDLSSQLKSLELTAEKALDQIANKDGAASTQTGTIDDKQNQHTTGYVNWNETHNILKTENWMKVSEFTEFCGKVERGVAPNFSTCITMDVKKVVDQDSRFPEDDLYVNVNSPLVRSEILYIKELQTEKPEVGLVERFLNAAKDEMHSCNSFEKKYGLKWVNPLPNTSNVIEAINDIPVSSQNNVEESIKHSVDTDFWSEEGTREEICSKVTAATDDVDSHDKLVTQALNNRFTKLLNQLNLRNFDLRMSELKNVLTDFPLDTQNRLDLVANLLLEKSLENPTSSEVYAKLAKKLLRLSVPSENNSSSKVTFRALIINACQTNFMTEKSDEHLKLEKELAECIDSHKKQELLMKIEESTKIARKRSVANAKFIGELYKVNMLTWNIVDYCLKTLLKELEEDKIECFCELLTTAGEYLEKNHGHILINYFKQMQDIIDYKSDEISKTSQFMIQDLIELRNRKWVAFKSMANVLPKTMDEIQKESVKRAHPFDLLETYEVTVDSSSGYDCAYTAPKKIMSTKKVTGQNSYSVDTLKTKTSTKATQNYIKVPPTRFIDLNKNMSDILEKLQADPTLRSESIIFDQDMTSTCQPTSKLQAEKVINDIPVSSLNNVEESTKHSVDTDFWCEEGTREEMCSKVTAATDDVDSHDKLVTQALSIKFTKLLNQLNVRNIDSVLRNALTFPLDNQKRLDLVANLLLEKSLENPRSSEVYAKLAKKLLRLSVPSENNPSSKVTFRALIINACQTNFETEKSDEHLKLEKELAECIDSHKKQELLMKIDESTKIARKRSVANAKFIGELYKLNMLTWKIVDYCLKTLLKELEEDNIECFCELLTTAGEYLEKDSAHTVINYFKQMQDIIDHKSDEISKTSQFMIQDLIELRNRKWVAFKSMANALPKTLHEIQEESVKRAHPFDLLETYKVTVDSSSGYDCAYIAQKKIMSTKKVTGQNSYSVDTLKLKASTKATQNYIKLPPTRFIDLNKNMSDILEKLQADPTLRTESIIFDQDVTSTCQPTSKQEPVKFIQPQNDRQVPITDLKMKSAVKSTIELFIINPDMAELVVEVKQLFPLQYHSAFIQEVLDLALEKTFKEIKMITNITLHLVATDTIKPKHFAIGLKQTLETAPDLFIDIPKLYDCLGNILAPHIEKDHITIAEIFMISQDIIAAKQGQLLLESIIDCLYENLGYESVKSKWQESGLQLSQWMSKTLVPEWIEGNNFEFLEDDL